MISSPTGGISAEELPGHGGAQHRHAVALPVVFLADPAAVDELMLRMS